MKHKGMSFSEVLILLSIHPAALEVSVQGCFDFIHFYFRRCSSSRHPTFLQAKRPRGADVRTERHFNYFIWNYHFCSWYEKDKQRPETLSMFNCSLVCVFALIWELWLFFHNCWIIFWHEQEKKNAMSSLCLGLFQYLSWRVAVQVGQESNPKRETQ